MTVIQLSLRRNLINGAKRYFPQHKEIHLHFRQNKTLNTNIYGLTYTYSKLLGGQLLTYHI